MSSGSVKTASPQSGSRIPVDLLDRITSARCRSVAAVGAQCLTVVGVGFIVGLGCALLFGGVLGELWGMSKGHMQVLIVLAIGGLFCLFYLPRLAYLALRQPRHAKTEATLARAHRVANIFRFICPSYYIPDSQSWGAF